MAGGLVSLGVALALRTIVRLVEERSRAEVLAGEARHYRELSQAAAGLAHEIRNPLGIVRGWTERLAAGDLEPQEQAQRARAVVEECDRVTARLNQFLAFARPCQPRLAPVDLGVLMDELSLILQPDLESKPVTLHVAEEMRSRPILADRELLREALFNLLQNAIHFSPPAGVIEIGQVESGPGQISVQIGDRGPGVAVGDQPALFSPYFTTRPGGTGLGLAMVRRIALARNWRVNWQSRSGGGSLFVLEGIHCWTRKTILVVDDEALQRELLGGFLTRLGFGFEAAESGEQALQIIQRPPPDMVLLDVRLPGISGIETLQQIRSHDSRAAGAADHGSRRSETSGHGGQERGGRLSGQTGRSRTSYRRRSTTARSVRGHRRRAPVCLPPICRRASSATAPPCGVCCETVAVVAPRPHPC